MDYRFEYLNYHNQFVEMLYTAANPEWTAKQKLQEIVTRLVVARWQMIEKTELTARPTVAELCSMIEQLNWMVFPPYIPEQLKEILTTKSDEL
jgi:hypothetical protein